MKETLIIAGFGGQGVLSMGKILAYAGVMQDFEVTWMPSYGPEMRGGTANVTVILSDRRISSPIAYEFDTAIILNQQSMDKFEPLVKAGGTLIYDVNGITNADLIKAMVGREITELFPKPEVKIGKEMLRVEDFSRTGYFKNVSFEVHAGEIVGLTGLVGAGRTEVVEAVCGITKPDSGKVYLEGQELHIHTPSEAMEKGIILLPEDRQKEGLIMSWGLGRNVTLPTISKYAKSGFNDEKKERELSKDLLEEVDTKAVDIFQPASSLSGGNQQKVVVAKALSQEMKVVIMDEPTKGVDVGAKAEIYAIMGELAQKGYAIILISSEMPEILGMADRIIVMCNGRKTGELSRDEATQEGILELAMEKGKNAGKEAR